MKKRTIFFAATIALISFDLIAQTGPNVTDLPKKTKNVRGCEYEVLPGLAEITSVRVIRMADASALKYDEYEVLFKFTPMEGDVLLEKLQNTEIEFVLRSTITRIPVGPQYIAQKNLKVGTKYAMNFLQTSNNEACLEQYTYESKVLDNDLFEAEDNIIPFIKTSFEEQQLKQELAYQNSKNQQKLERQPEVAKIPTKSVLTEDEPVDFTIMTEAEMRAYLEAKIRREQAATTKGIDAETGINLDSLQKAIESEMRVTYKDQLDKSTEKLVDKTTTISKAQAIQNAKKEQAEKERLEKLEAKKKEQAEKDRLEKIEQIKAQIEADVEAKIKAQIEANQLAAQQQKVIEEQALLEENQKKEAALQRLKKIEDELKAQLVNEQKRKECVFGERISGTIEIVNVSKKKEASESYFKYTEFEVIVLFRPDNYASLSKKDQKQWDTRFTFTLDPTGANANPSANYIRKYKVFKASQYQGFAQGLESGVCNSMMIYSPDLPIDAAKIKLN